MHEAKNMKLEFLRFSTKATSFDNFAHSTVVINYGVKKDCIIFLACCK